MVDILTLENNVGDLTQVGFASLATFDFNPALVRTACQHLKTPDLEQQLLTIIENKTLLINEREPISVFFARVGEQSIMKSEYKFESIRPMVKNGLHLMRSKTLLTSKEEFVSMNEESYCIRLGSWFIQCENKEFSPIINECFDRRVMVVNRDFDVETIKSKSDVKSFDGKSIILITGKSIEFIQI